MLVEWIFLALLGSVTCLVVAPPPSLLASLRVGVRPLLAPCLVSLTCDSPSPSSRAREEGGDAPVLDRVQPFIELRLYQFAASTANQQQIPALVAVLVDPPESDGIAFFRTPASPLLRQFYLLIEESLARSQPPTRPATVKRDCNCGVVILNWLDCRQRSARPTRQLDGSREIVAGTRSGRNFALLPIARPSYCPARRPLSACADDAARARNAHMEKARCSATS